MSVNLNSRRDNAARENVCSLYRSGKSVKEIGKLIGRHHSLPAKWIRQAGLTRSKAEQCDQNGRKQSARWALGLYISKQKTFNPERIYFESVKQEMRVVARQDFKHWANHPEALKSRKDAYKLKALANYYNHHEASKAARRLVSKRIYHEKKGDAAYVAKKRAGHSAWVSRNVERAKSGKKAAHKRWRQRPENKLAMAQRRRFKEIMQAKNPLRTVDMIGCSVAFLRQWLESKWGRGMSWTNYGSHWCIDHVIPCASFDFGTKDNVNQEQVRRCFHYSNLQPLTNVENIVKLDRIIPTQPELLMSILE